MIRWFAVSIFGLISTGVIWAFIARHKFNVKFKFWWLNYTKDGDFGEEKWRKDKGLKDKSIWTAMRWWWRNHSWEYISLFNPPWYAGKVDKDKNGKDIFRTIYSSVKDNEEYGRFTRAHKKDKNYGIKFIAYQIDQKVYFQFSAACRFIQIHMGSGGRRYRFNIKF
jgi:hypothetical protein